MSMTDPLIGKRLGDYMIEDVLGVGGMARVYRGYDDNLDRHAAIKVIEPQLIASAEEDEYRERFLREARAIARLNHPRIVSIYQFNQVGTLYYIAMEYIEGRNLRDILKGYLRQGRLIPTDELLQLLRDIADALDYAHKQGIIHRDIKPSNIIVTGEGHAVLTDFGLALNAVEGTIGNTFGSVHYIAPEQAISSAQAVPQSDQYSLGIVAYELLTGRVPFDDASAMSVALKHISDPPPPPTELNPNIPAEVEQVLLRVLDKEVSKRFETSKEFVQNLEIAFEMSHKGDIEAPSAITAAIGGQPETSPLPPPELVKTKSGLVKLGAELGNTDTASEPVSKNTGTQSQPLTPAGRMGWLVAAALIVVVAVIVGFMIMSNIARDNQIATETEQAIVMLQTDSAVATIVEETNVAAAVAIEETSAARTESAIIAQQTSDAAQTEFAQATSIAATSAQETNDANAQATSIAATSAQETNDANAQATSIAATSAQETSLAQTEASQIVATENAIATTTARVENVTPTPTITSSPQPSNTPTVIPTNTPRPTNTPLPSLFIEDENDTQQLLLRYDGRSLIIANRDTLNPIDISDLVFILFEPDEDGNFVETTNFDLRSASFADEAKNMIPERCLQILDNTQFSALPTDNTLAETICGARPFWLASSRTFWLSSNPDAYIEVRISPVDVIGRCQTQRPQTRAEKRCTIDLRALRN